MRVLPVLFVVSVILSLSMIDAYPLTFDGIKEKAKGFITSLGSHPFKTAAAITAVGTAAGVATGNDPMASLQTAAVVGGGTSALMFGLKNLFKPKDKH